MPVSFTDATGALFYTEDGTATGGGGIAAIYKSIQCRVLDSYYYTHIHERL